jgi:hypothetical protein
MPNKSSSSAGGLHKFDSSGNDGGGAVFHVLRSAMRGNKWDTQRQSGKGENEGGEFTVNERIAARRAVRL